MNSTIDLIQTHRSIRKFTDQTITSDVLDQIMLAGSAASTSSYIQAVSIIRISEQSKRKDLAGLAGNQDYVETAAEFLVFCADLNRNNQRVQLTNSEAEFCWTEQFLTASIDVALVAQNIVIAAESCGLGCCFIGGIRNNPKQVSKLLRLPSLVYPVFGLCLGYPDQHPEIKPRLPLSVVVQENEYNWNEQFESDIDEFDEVVREYYLKRTRGKLDVSWSEQIVKQAKTQSRPFMKEFLNKKGFMLK